MTERNFIFRGGLVELVLPVSPREYRIEKGVNVEVVNIHELGDTIAVGYGTLATIQLHCLLPARPYSFVRSADPDRYIRQFSNWIEEKARLRFIVGNTGVNLPVILQSLTYGEQDGTNDVYADLILREYRALPAAQANAPEENQARDTATVKDPGETHYTIQYGDSLSALCRKYYGDGSASVYNKLAAYNGIANPHLIYAGNTLKFPWPLT